MTMITQISCLVWMLIIYSGHDMCVNARDLCEQTRFRSQGKGEEWEEEEKEKYKKAEGATTAPSALGCSGIFSN